ncbi:hypothetical protein VCHENC01_2118 [Vibrio harveyi]|nr:hypothetical protein VCHENC01_2118 [Vibrio harveyi]
MSHIDVVSVSHLLQMHFVALSSKKVLVLGKKVLTPQFFDD